MNATLLPQVHSVPLFQDSKCDRKRNCCDRAYKTHDLVLLSSFVKDCKELKVKLTITNLNLGHQHEPNSPFALP